MIDKLKLYLKKQSAYPMQSLSTTPGQSKSILPYLAMGGGLGAVGLGLYGLNNGSPDDMPDLSSSTPGPIQYTQESLAEDNSSLPYMAGGASALGGAYGLKKFISNKLAASRAAAANAKLKGKLGLGVAALGGLGLGYSMLGGKNERTKDKD